MYYYYNFGIFIPEFVILSFIVSGLYMFVGIE